MSKKSRRTDKSEVRGSKRNIDEVDSTTSLSIPLDDVECNTCFSTCEEPIYSPCCGRVFCITCVELWFVQSWKPWCPCCRTVQLLNQARFPVLWVVNQYMRRRLREMQAKCPNSENGCSVVVARKNIAQHRLECPYEGVPCAYCGETHYFMDAHLETCPQFPLTCEYCIGKVTRRDLKHHNKSPACLERLLSLQRTTNTWNSEFLEGISGFDCKRDLYLIINDQKSRIAQRMYSHCRDARSVVFCDVELLLGHRMSFGEADYDVIRNSRVAEVFTMANPVWRKPLLDGQYDKSCEDLVANRYKNDQWEKIRVPRKGCHQTVEELGIRAGDLIFSKSLANFYCCT